MTLAPSKCNPRHPHAAFCHALLGGSAEDSIAPMQTQDFDKLEGILKDYKRFMSESPHVDDTLPNHVHLGGFASDGLHVHVHVCSWSHL